MLDISHLGLPPPCQDLREVEGNPKELEVPSPPGAALIASVLHFFFPSVFGAVSEEDEPVATSFSRKQSCELAAETRRDGA